MTIEIKRLSPERIADFFDFFDHRAFTDNPPWGGCYCIGWQMTKEEEQAQVHDQAAAYGGDQDAFMRALREVVVRQIQADVLQGYLAYVDGLPIGWYNANDRVNFPETSANGFHFHCPTPGREKAVVCFEIAPAYRGKGVATALLARVVEDAAAEGYEAIEAYPCVHDQRDEWDFPGPIRLYEKAGFTQTAEQPDGVRVMRKELR